jgi:hypothetical protein
VYENVVNNCRALIQGVQQLKLPFEKSENAQAAQNLMQVPSDQVFLKPAEVFLPRASQIKALWSDKAVKSAYENRAALQLNDSTQ